MIGFGALPSAQEHRVAKIVHATPVHQREKRCRELAADFKITSSVDPILGPVLTARWTFNGTPRGLRNAGTGRVSREGLVNAALQHLLLGRKSDS